MVLEEEIPKFSAWIGPALVSYLFAAGLVAVFAAASPGSCSRPSAGRSWPVTASTAVCSGARRSGRHVAATDLGPGAAGDPGIAAAQRARRARLFALIVLFAGWFLDPTSVNPGKLYLGFILSATNLLVCLVVLVLSVFSLPADIKAKAIQTVTTKPVRTGEIVLGRMLGFAIVGTVLLAMMGLVGWAFVVRSVRHGHTPWRPMSSRSRPRTAPITGSEGRTSLDRGHRHRVELGADGTGAPTPCRGIAMPFAPSRRTAERPTKVGPPEGLLEARKPLRGRLRFLDREGRPEHEGDQRRRRVVVSAIHRGRFAGGRDLDVRGRDGAPSFPTACRSR
jgi:hypothetical protein